MLAGGLVYIPDWVYICAYKIPACIPCERAGRAGGTATHRGVAGEGGESSHSFAGYTHGMDTDGHMDRDTEQTLKHNRHSNMSIESCIIHRAHHFYPSILDYRSSASLSCVRGCCWYVCCVIFGA